MACGKGISVAYFLHRLFIDVVTYINFFFQPDL